MGRPSKPTPIKLVEGNPGKRAINKREPMPKNVPVRPKIMSPDAKKVWYELTGAMPAGVYTAADSKILAAYCEACVAHQVATKMIIETPAQVTGSMGQSKPSEWFGQQRAAAESIIKLGAKLGLDPVSRQAIQSEHGQANDDGFGGLIN